MKKYIAGGLAALALIAAGCGGNDTKTLGEAVDSVDPQLIAYTCSTIDDLGEEEAQRWFNAGYLAENPDEIGYTANEAWDAIVGEC